MQQNPIADHERMSELRHNLSDARETLQKSHLGLNDEIERVLEAVSTWNLFHGTQERPRVLGLWGMTGTGKSSMVRMVLQAMGLHERTFWMDAGECRRGQWLEQHLELLRTHLNGAPFVVVIDEFHQARTVKAGAEQEEAPELRRMWELIDAGRAVLMPGYRHLEDLMDIRDVLSILLADGVVVRNGRVVHGIDKAHKAMAIHMSRGDHDEDWVLPKSTWRMLRESNSGTCSLTALQRKMEVLDGAGILGLLEQAITEARIPHVFDARQALVIVLGNLDELYVMGREPMPALDPDVLLARHEDLGTSGVQRALLGLFRVEQVARLGTDHVVLPPMGRSTVHQLVEREVKQLVIRTGAHAGVEVRISNSLLERIQEQAAIPVLGARPVVEAVQQVVPALLSQVLLHPWPDPVKAISLECNKDRAHATVELASGTNHMVLRWPMARPVAERDTPENTFRVAIHEAGHVICGNRLYGGTPLQACVRTGQTSMAGFVIWLKDERMLLRSMVFPRLAQMLGGYLAEELVYGPEGCSTGSDNDLHKASSMALDLVRNHGLSGDLRYQTIHPEAPGDGFRLGLPDVEQQAKLWLDEAATLARNTLAQERGLLDAIAKRLAEAGSLGRAELEELLSDEHLSDAQLAAKSA